MKLKTILSAAFLAAAASSAALAQDASRWSGFYGGISAASFGGFEDFEPFGSDDYNLIGTSFGIFGGYMYASGAFAYGAEIALNNGEAYEQSLGGGASYPDYNYSNNVELKGRVGYATGSALVYGTLGYVFGEYDYSGISYDADGVLYGLGVDYALNDRFFAGIEYVRRDLETDYPTKAGVDTLTIRAGLSF